MQMIMVTLRIVAPLQKRDAVLRTMRSLLGPIRVKPGCISCCCYQDLENDNALTIVEEWRSQQDLFRHVHSREYKKIITLIESSSEDPEIKYNVVSETWGIEKIKTFLDENNPK